MPPLSIRHPIASLAALFGNLRWLAGFLVGIGGWAFYVAALKFGPLSLVQAVSAGGIGVLALLVSRVSHIRLTHIERLGVVLSIGGLALLGISLLGGEKAHGHGQWTTVSLWIIGAVALAGFFAGPGGRALVPGAGLGVAAGLLYAAGDVATKAAVAGGVALLFVVAVFACHGLAFVSLQLGFQRGSAIATAGVATLFTNAMPIAAGMLVFGERIPSGVLGVLRLAAFAAVVLGAAMLSRPETQPATPAQPTQPIIASGRWMDTVDR
jgi:hypothetical protein